MSMNNGNPIHLNTHPALAILFQGGIHLKGDTAHILRTRTRIEDACKQLVDNASKTKYDPAEKEQDEEIIKELRKSPMLKDLTMKRYGSRLQGLALKGVSDLDLFIGKRQQFELEPKPLSDAEVSELKKYVLEAIRGNQKFTTVEEKERNLGCVYNGLPCDFSFMSGMAYRNSCLVRFICDKCPQARALTLFLKFWSEENGIRYYFIAYLSFLLVTFFLQNLDDGPVLQPLSKIITSQEKIGGWNAGCNQQGPLLLTERKMDNALLLKKFFKFYLNFDFANNIICVLTGKPIPRNHLTSKSPNLPLEILQHWDKFDKKAMEGFSPDIKMAVMGPIELSANVAHRIGSEPRAVEAFKNLMKLSLEIMENPTWN